MPQIRSEDWFVTIDLKDAYFHISILPYRRKFLRFALGGRTYQYRVLPFCLALSPRTFTKYVDAALAPLCLQGIRIMNYIDDWLILAQSHQAAVQHRDDVLAHMKELGLRLNAKKSVLSPIEKGHFSWRGMRLNIDAGAPVTGTYRVHSVGCKKYKARPVTHCQTVSETVRSYGSSIQRDAFGLLYMRHMQWWPCNLDYVKSGCPSGKTPFHIIKVTRRCLRALLMWKQPWFLSQGPMLWASFCRKMLTTDAVSHGLGSDLRGTLKSGSVEGPSSLMAHQPSGDVGCISCLRIS